MLEMWEGQSRFDTRNVVQLSRRPFVVLEALEILGPLESLVAALEALGTLKARLALELDLLVLETSNIQISCFGSTFNF